MREILFRGKRVDNGEWVYGYYCPVVRGKFPATPCIVPDCDGVWEGIPIIPETVGQYTGFKDKYGNEVFEGDIVEFISVDLSNPRIVATIKYGEYKNQPLCEGCSYSDWHLGFYMQSVNGKGSILLGSSEETCIKNIGEVVGNIHDNLVEGS